jgi:TetR/AcrR family transcriptional regulator, transcriptional repressor for nem operon
MRLSKQRIAENHRQIVEAAARLFQQHGFDRVGVAELMRDAGFTHGGFYNHFESKEALAAEACAHVFERVNASLTDRLDKRSASAWQSYVADYLAPERLNTPSDDATLATLAADASRQGVKVQSAFAAGIETTLNAIANYLASRNAGPARTNRKAARALAAQRLSTLVGASVLARAVSRARPELSSEILAANREGRKPSRTRSRRVSGRLRP